MKYATFTIEFISHCLSHGNRIPTEDCDKFQRDGDNALIFHQSWFYTAFAKALGAIQLRGVRPGDILVDPTVNAPTTVFNRRYSRVKFRKHESILSGTRVTFKAMVSDNITTSVLNTLLKHVGAFIGISPYGYKLGYGKFNVIEVEVQPSDEAK